MSAQSQPLDPARRDRALDRIYEHTLLVEAMTRHIEQRRAEVRARLEDELGHELTVKLLAGLAPAA